MQWIHSTNSLAYINEQHVILSISRNKAKRAQQKWKSFLAFHLPHSHVCMSMMAHKYTQFPPSRRFVWLCLIAARSQAIARATAAHTTRQTPPTVGKNRIIPSKHQGFILFRMCFLFVPPSFRRHSSGGTLVSIRTFIYDIIFILVCICTRI